ncbi:uncharacterized protein LOC133532279 [Cydia pomonella]|uniref:uncharacterized protein LOC133532279 n=1 Tax=Cydia pomonella TaxID=82600 RepID=UPI002ADD3351|nr:uncharacterized protein LOC133532279 [Cydia pomonella]
MRWTVLCLVTYYLASHAYAQQTLKTINFLTNIGATVDINLSNSGTSGTCRLKQPNGLEVDLASLNVVGVTVQPSSKFVSCRVTIGPMTAALLGSWELIENSGLTSRIQPATIAWADTANPSATARQRVLSGEQHYKVDVGGLVVANLRRETGIFEGCFITAPDGTTMPLSDTTDYPGIEWTLRSNSVNICHVQLGPIDADMVGTWMMRGWFVHDGLLIEAQQPVVVHEEDGIEHLPALEYLTHTGKSYDISLNRTVNLATCILIDPTGTEHTLSTASSIPGVTVYSADQYVICRVRIGPMEQSLLGEWTLVQQNTDNTQRRQHVIFQWANPSNPDEESWFVAHDVPRQIFATTGSTTEIFIGRNEGFFEFCYITTPAGVHLPMYGRNYPGIQHVLSNRVSSCVVELGPLNTEMWGDWTLHARHDVDGRPIELAQVFHVTQDTGVRTLPRMRQWTNIGATVDINLNQTGVSSTCRLQAPSGIEYVITPGATPIAGVTVHSSSNYVSCRVTIGPMAENLLGQWVLAEQSTGLQRRQPVIIQWAHPAHPERDARQLIIAPELTLPTDLEGIVEVAVGREMGTFEGCFLTIPDGTVIPVMYNTFYPGIRLGQPNRMISCPIEIGPVTADMVGRYTLSGMGIHVGFRTETQQSFTIIEDDGITNLPSLQVRTHTGDNVDINLEQTGSIGIGTCMLRNPAGQIFVLDSTFNSPGITVHSSSKFVACRVTIGPMSDDLLGDWTLMHQVSGQRERRVHASIFWANPMDPSWSYQVITAPEQNVIGAFGDIITVTVPWHPGMPISCVIIAPDGTVMPHSEGHNYPGVGWARANSVASCTALLGPLDDSMLGKWTLAARFDDDGSLLESQQSITLGRNTGNELELPALEYLTNVDALVDLSLNNMNSPVQSCALLTPDGEYHELAANSNIAGVTVHGPNKFVSCRVTIGPMTEQLLGTWTLVENGADGGHRRQAALFSWANPSNPNAVPRLMIASQYELRADTGEIRNMFVSREDGFFEGCFITTPDGTVLPLFPHMEYPGIAHAGVNRITACFVNLGPMDGDMVGTWTIAARFNNAGSRVESQLPINIVLVDGTHIYLPIHELTYFGGYVDLNLNQTGTTGGCSLTTPDGQEHILGTTSSIPGVAIHAASKFVACRVVIGPMTESLLGDWVITHLGSDNTERHQSMTIAWENPADPSAQRQVTTQAQQSYSVRPSTIISTSIAREDGLPEGCFLTTPDGTVLPVLRSNAYPGTIWAGTNRFTACFVQIGPVDPEEEGIWILTAKSNNYGVRTELRIPIQVTLIHDQNVLTDNLPRREVFTNTGGFIDIALNETGMDGSCSLRNPAGQTFLLQNTVMVSGVEVRESNQFVSCNVRIGPMSQELLGTWTLIQQDSLTTERTQPVQISWAHPASPQDPPTLIRQAVEEIVVEENDVFTLAAPRNFNDSFSEGCFIITPDSTTLPIFGNNRYPGIQNAGANRHTICFVDVGPITAEMAGPWTLFSVVNRAGERIISETPTHITISDGVIRLPTLQHVAHEGHFIDLALNQTGQTGNCLLRVPSGHEYTLTTAGSLDGITAHEQSKFVSCRVVIGPITETLIGDWVLIQQFTDPHLREQPATISWANPDNITAEVWDYRTELDRDIYGDYGASVEISIPRQNLNYLFEGCFITTPDGTTLPIFPNHAYPGIAHLGINRVTACFVELGPIDSDMAGTWVLAARFNDNGVRHEDRQPFILAIGPPPATFNATALIVSLTVIFGLVLIVVGVLSYKPARDWSSDRWNQSRSWSTQRWNRLRSSMRSVSSRSPVVDHELGSRS